MKRVLINVLVLACAVFTVTAQPTRHEVKVGNFSRLVVTADVNVDYRCNPDSAGLAVMYCEQSVASHFICHICTVYLYAAHTMTIVWAKGNKHVCSLNN